MHRYAELLDACQEWSRLAKAEGDAIESGNWKYLDDCHGLIQNLQVRIDRIRAEARPDGAEARPDGAEWKSSPLEERRRLQTILSELMERVRHNSERLQARRAAAGGRIAELSRASRNLRRLRHSYALPGSPAWTSHS